MLNNDKLKSKETEIVILKGIMNAINGVSSNLTTEGEEEGSTVSIFSQIAEALGTIATNLATIAEKLDPLYVADYVEPEPDPDEGGEGGDDTPPADPSDNNGEGGEGGNDPDPSDDTEPGVS